MAVMIVTKYTTISGKVKQKTTDALLSSFDEGGNYRIVASPICETQFGINRTVIVSKPDSPN